MAAITKTDDATSGTRARLSNIRTIEKESGPAAAERATIEFLREEPKSHLAFVTLARLLAKQQRYDDAIRAAEKAKALAPLEVEPLLALGFVHLRKQQHSEAAVAFSEAITLDPGSARAHLGAAAVKMMDENYEEALMLCEKVLDIDPSLERAHELIARINVRQGRKDLAVEELKTLVANNPDNKRVLKAYVRLMKSEGRSDEALAFLESDVENEPNDRRRVYRLSRYAVSAGRPDVAVEHYKRLAEGESAKPTDKIRYIVALTENGDLDAAGAMVDGLGDRRIFVPVAAKLRGDIALKAGETDKALANYKQACAKAKVSPPTASAEAEAKTPEDKAKLWKAHTRKTIIEAVREYRADRT
ncbi:tetratricopeptide repeat protein [Actibacterium sp. D379-3]